MPNRESIFKTVTTGGVKESSVDDIIKTITEQRSSEAEYDLLEAASITENLWNAVSNPDPKPKVKASECYKAFLPYLQRTDNIQGERDEHFYDQYVLMDKLPVALVCNATYEFLSKALDNLQKYSRNFSKLGAMLRTRDINKLLTSKIFSPFRDFFKENTDYSNNLQSFLKDVHVLKDVFDALDAVLFGNKAPYSLYNAYYYDDFIHRNPNFKIKDIVNDARSKYKPDQLNSDFSNLAVYCKFYSFVSKSIEAFNTLGQKLNTLRAKFNKFFKEVLDVETSFNHAKAANNDQEFNKQQFLNRPENLTSDSSATTVGSRFHNKSVTLPGKSSAHDAVSADPEHNEYLRYYEICKGVIDGATHDTLELLNDDQFATKTIPAFFSEVAKLEKQGCVPLYQDIGDQAAANFLIRMRTIYNCLRVVSNAANYKEDTSDNLDFNTFKRNCDLRSFKDSLATLEKEKILTWKYVIVKDDSGVEKNSVKVTLTNADELNVDLSTFNAELIADNFDKRAISVVNKITTFMKDLDKYYLVDTAILADGKDASCVTNGVIRKADRKLPDTSEGRAQKLKNLAKSARNKLVRDIKCWSVADVIKNKGKLPETASRAAFPEFDKYNFVVVDSNGSVITEANHDGKQNSTVSKETGIRDERVISNLIYRMAVTSMAYGQWKPANADNLFAYDHALKNRYIVLAR